MEDYEFSNVNESRKLSAVFPQLVELLPDGGHWPQNLVHGTTDHFKNSVAAMDVNNILSTLDQLVECDLIMKNRKNEPVASLPSSLLLLAGKHVTSSLLRHHGQVDAQVFQKALVVLEQIFFLLPSEVLNEKRSATGDMYNRHQRISKVIEAAKLSVTEVYDDVINKVTATLREANSKTVQLLDNTSYDSHQI